MLRSLREGTREGLLLRFCRKHMITHYLASINFFMILLWKSQRTLGEVTDRLDTW